jgi:hypothetical protein
MAITKAEFESRLLAALEAIEAAQEAALLAPGAGAIHVTYVIPMDFGAGGTFAIEGHPALRGKVVDCSIVNVSEALDSASEVIDVGDAGDDDEFAVIAVGGTIAIGASRHPAIVDGVSPIIPIGHDVIVEFTSAGTEGIADVHLTIAYFV